MKKTALCLALLGLLALGGQAFAVICTIDEVPAATLLLPYFQVDLSNPNGENTLFSINNASATAVLAHVVVWSDLSHVVLDFNVYLTGYDVQTINLRDIIQNGNLPVTASAGQDPKDTISPKGDFSQDINFASCQNQLPLGPLPANYVAHLQAALTGHFSQLFQGCFGFNHGDNVARGYITVDTVNSCTLQNPGDPLYFAQGGGGLATNQNVLWGDYFYVNDAQNFADGNPLVHIEASGTNPETSTPGQYTFYGRYNNPTPWVAADNREPLSTNFAVRFLNGGDFDGGTDLQVWRDSKTNIEGPFACPSGTPTAADLAKPNAAPWYPLGQEGIVIFDEEEQPNLIPGVPVSPPPPTQTNIPFPLETQSVHVGSDALPVPFAFGWLYLNLNTTVSVQNGIGGPPEDPAAAQAWVTARMTASGRFSVGFDAVQLDSACAAVHFCPGGCGP